MRAVMEFDGPFHCTVAGDFHLGLKWRMLWLIIVNNGCISPFLKPITWQRMDLQETKWRKQVDIVVPRITITKLNVLFAKKKKNLISGYYLKLISRVKSETYWNPVPPSYAWAMLCFTVYFELFITHNAPLFAQLVFGFLTNTFLLGNFCTLSEF